jgi:transcriptional regulatory protein LEU3
MMLTTKRYLQCFHPYLPVLRKKIPNECYDASPILFWTVIYVATRRYAREETLAASLNELLNRDVWTVISAPAHDLETIHTLLMLCAWPFPSIRFVTDPSSTFISIALNSCLLLGLHTGRGSHPRYCIGGRLNMHFTDQEASVTWMFCCILAQKYVKLLSMRKTKRADIRVQDVNKCWAATPTATAQ